MTTEQLTIVAFPATERLLITAGAGTGKTEVLVARAAKLVGQGGLSPGAQIAVLTFSRAAAREIRGRASAAGGDVRYLRVVTFDSFATRLLFEFDGGGEWSNLNYDGRIRAATDLIRRVPDVRTRIGAYAHVFVDEVQDLVGDRADFLKEILETVSGGFTLLGDPAQGIYNFQLKGAARTEGSAAFYRWVRDRFRGKVREISLYENHRAATDRARVALWAGPLLNAHAPDYAAIKVKLETLLWKLPSIGRLVDGCCGCLKNVSKPTAILCCTNGQALMISRNLHEMGVPHLLQRRATDRALPEWIAIVFNGFDFLQIGRSAFMTKVGEHFDGELDPEKAWNSLQRASGGNSATLNLARLAERIRLGNVSDDLMEREQIPLVVSTIHRAKGLEFDRVILAVPDGEFRVGQGEYVAEDTRLLYVALTRPRNELQHMELPKFRGLCECQDRWIRRFKWWQTVDVELRGDDVHKEHPAGGFVLGNCDPKFVQTYLKTAVHRGDSVRLAKIRESVGGEPRVFYSIEHDSNPIGITSESFGATLLNILKVSRGWEVQWPERIDDVRIETVDTVAGSQAAGFAAGLGRSGMWLRARINGLGALRFRTDHGQ